MSKDKIESLLRKAKDPACTFEEAATARNMAENLMQKHGYHRRSKEKIFIKGFYVREPKPKKPPWVLFELSIRREELLRWLEEQQGEWINAQVCKSKDTGNWYAEVDQWEKKK